MGTSIPVASTDFTDHELKHLYRSVSKGYLTHRGEYERMFEKSFSKLVRKGAIATSSGTAALHIALQSLGIGRNDEVILPVLTFGGCASAVVAVGAWPVFVDGFPMRWDLVKKAVTKKTRAIMPVHLYGERCHFEDIGIPIVEDCCEALGYVEPTGTMSAYSFYGNKVITTGEGGMLVGDIEEARPFRDGGFDSEYDMMVPALNYRMTNMQAAIGFAQLERLPEILAKRNKILDVYQKRLKGVGKWLFVAKTRDPKSLAATLQKHGIETRPVFMPLHLTRSFEMDQRHPEAVEFWKTGLCLPVGTHLTETDAIRISNIVNEHERS